MAVDISQTSTTSSSQDTCCSSLVDHTIIKQTAEQGSVNHFRVPTKYKIFVGCGQRIYRHRVMTLALYCAVYYAVSVSIDRKWMPCLVPPQESKVLKQHQSLHLFIYDLASDTWITQMSPFKRAGGFFSDRPCTGVDIQCFAD